MIKHKPIGIGLLELMLALAIIAMMMVAASKYYQTTQMARRVQVVVESAQAVYSAGERYQLDVGGFDSSISSNLVKYGYLPEKFLDSANPWSSAGATINVVSGSTKQLLFTLTSVPKQACANIQAKLTGGIFAVTGCDSGTTTTITINNT